MRLARVRGREFKSFDILAKLGIRKKEIIEDDVYLYAYNKIIMDLKPIRLQLQLLSVDERFSKQKGAEINIRKLAKLTESISVKANWIVEFNLAINPEITETTKNFNT